MTIQNLLIGMPMMVLCLIAQTASLFWCVRYYVRQAIGNTGRPGFLAGIRPLVICTIVMMLGNLVEIALWGWLFLWLGEFPRAYEAMYHSAVNFSSLGYGDIVMSPERRLLGPLEAVNGVLMLGMTAAALMAIVQHMIKSQQDAIVAAAREGRG
jgi:hypothetical protein